MGIVRTSMGDGRLVTGSTSWYSCKCIVRSSCGFDLSKKKKKKAFYIISCQINSSHPALTLSNCSVNNR